MKRYITGASVRRSWPAVLALPLLFGAQVGHAQTTEAAVMEEVVVTGIRGSLQRSMDIRRNESGVVDSITAQDIGKFPDTNLAESLQRITGVSIDRQKNEGNQITVRGLGPSFNMVTLNGRQMPVASSPEQESIASATQSRAFNFAEIASESVTGVNVYKTARPDVPSGGIGATVDIRTARPFDYDEMTIFANAFAVHDSSVRVGDDVTPEFGGLFSTQFADGQFGVLANFSYANRQFSEPSVHTDGWARDNPGEATFTNWCENSMAECAGIPYIYRPITQISEIQHAERTRTNAQFVAQWAPSDTVTVTADYVLSRFRLDADRFQTGLFGVVSPGVFNLQLSDTYTVQSALRTNAAADSIVYANRQEIENDAYGLNIDWALNDTVNVEFDIQTSQAVSQPGNEINDNTQILQGALGVDFGLSYRPDGVDITVDDSSGCPTPGLPCAFRGEDQFGGGTPRPNVNGFLSPNGFSPLGSVIRIISIDNEIDQARLELDWNFDDVVLTTGINYIDYQVATNAVSSGFVFQNLDDCDGCADLIVETPTEAPSGFQTTVQFPINQLLEQTFPIQIADIVAANPPTFFGASEETIAVYFNLATDFELGSIPGRLNAGFRWETTDVTGSAFQTFPESLTIFTITEGTVNFPPGAEPVPFSIDADYEVFLPALDFSLEPTENIVTRLSYGRTLARPDLNALRPITTVSDYRPGIATANSGNPAIRPYLADNIDLAVEYYYGDASFATLTFFYKQVDDYITNEVVQDVILDVNGNPLRNPEARFDGTVVPNVPVTSEPGDPIAIFDVTRPLNSAERGIDGWELAVQHLFGDSGFGIQANYTVVSSDAEYDPSNFNQQAILIGLSDSWNLVPFFENEYFSVRVAANWRDEFLFAENQLRVTNEPVYFDEYLQIDLSASWNITDNLTLAFDALNLTGEDQLQRGRYVEQFLLENDQDPRYAIGIRARF
ncbi:MAG: TonB-dependent receptor [Woeseiaceae bacterium]|nr:TonB-dependent receptor [Woeseiaceae bacterium]